MTITVSTNDKIYPKTEKENPCKPDMENVLLDKGLGWIVSSQSLLLTNQIIQRIRLLRYIKKIWDVLNIFLYQIRNLSSGKNSCKAAFRNKLFADICDPAGYSIPLRCTVHAFPNDREDTINAGNDKGTNERHYSLFQAHISK